uniref:ataxin-7-like protein 2b n=1 Tax=Semicossyphus pulcher TaxID=241346 RepID=UPI0037E9785A
MTCCETMTLRKEDMHIYGHCPAHDEIYLVVCSLCGQVVKPQAFEKHCERRHGPLTKMWGQSSAFASQLQRPRPGRPTSNLSSSTESQTDTRCHEASAPSSAALPDHQHISTKAQKETVSFPSVEKFPQETPPPLPLHSSSTPRPRVSLWHSGPLPPGHCSSSTSPSAQKLTAGQPSKSQSPLRGTRTHSRVHKNIDEKECDLNKHCGVLDPERKKRCSRELICKTDSIQQQQKALGRTKTSDQLAVEPKTASAGRNMEQLLVKTKDNLRHLEALEDKITTQGSKYHFNSSCHILRSRGPPESFTGEEGDSTVEVEVQPPYPFNQTLLSSDEDEDDKQEEATDLPATPWHPKPLGLCTFGCRTFGCSIFTFDRRWHHLRFALSAMLEHHVSTHMWKKAPRVPSGLRSCHAPSPVVGSPVRTGVRPPKSPGTLSLDSTSLSHTDTKISQHYAQFTKPPSSTPANLSTGQRCSNPTVRRTKAQVREVELMQDAKSEDKHIRDAPLHEKGQPQAPSSNGPVNGSFSDGKKPCPLLHQSPRSRRRPPGTQQKVIDCDHTGPGQKRKGNNESLSSSRSRTSKCQRLSSASRSSLLAWKGENNGDVLAWSMEKRADS